ncbi:MAG: hypothetical protein EP318_01415 [Rhodobacteraceae bacterium]|nr:MAG: hypothetical protein EP318_01415 [Paracoccaceae bacterium]
MTDIPDHAGPGLRFLLRVPVLGWIARDLLYGARDNIYYFLVILLTMEILLIMAYGLPALALSALALVPIVMGLLIAVTRG